MIKVLLLDNSEKINQKSVVVLKNDIDFAIYFQIFAKKDKQKLRHFDHR